MQLIQPPLMFEKKIQVKLRRHTLEMLVSAIVALKHEFDLQHHGLQIIISLFISRGGAGGPPRVTPYTG